MKTRIEAAIAYIKAFFSADHSGHDAQHTMRVYHMAMRLAKAEGADLQVVALASLLHDVDDKKISPQTHEKCSNALRFLQENGTDESVTGHVLDVIRGVSFSDNGGKIPATVEGRVVQDADRLDALGAIGIARTFAYGGNHGQTLEKSLAHFDEKLLRLRDMMTTEEGRRIAQSRHTYMEEFLRQYRDETEGLR